MKSLLKISVKSDVICDIPLYEFICNTVMELIALLLRRSSKSFYDNIVERGTLIKEYQIPSFVIVICYKKSYRLLLTILRLNYLRLNGIAVAIEYTFKTPYFTLSETCKSSEELLL